MENVSSTPKLLPFSAYLSVFLVKKKDPPKVVVVYNCVFKCRISSMF